MPEVEVMKLRRGKPHADRVFASLQQNLPDLKFTMEKAPGLGDQYTLKITGDVIGAADIEKAKNHVALVPLDEPVPVTPLPPGYLLRDRA